MKHAYLITTNGKIPVLDTCLELLDDDRNNFYILFDKKAHIPKKIKEGLCKRRKSKVFLLPEMVINWASFSQIAAEITLLKAALVKGYDYYHYLQGTDLPIKTVDEIDRFFEKNIGTEFIYTDLQNHDFAKKKCHYYHLFCHNRFYRTNIGVKALNHGLVFLQQKINIKHNTDIELYQGSALFSITHNFATYLVSHEKEIRKRYRYSLAADEVFLTTMLFNSSFHNKIMMSNDHEVCNARLIDWERCREKNSPHVWRADEFDYIINQPESVCFARKFDDNVDFEIVQTQLQYRSAIFQRVER